MTQNNLSGKPGSMGKIDQAAMYSTASRPGTAEPADWLANENPMPLENPPSGDATADGDSIMMRRLLRAAANGDLPFLYASPVALGPREGTKEEAIREMLASLVASGALPKEEVHNVLTAVLVRESLASTGIGEGVAIPHATHAAVARVMGAIGWSTQGIEFDSVDKACVRLVILLLSPLGGRAEHVQALAKVARHLRSDRWNVDAPGRQANQWGETPLMPGWHC